ncbi:Uncharacterised protein [Legionella lansingensis]|uniref:Uncharacterized protein n=1 Tax=Legionella lansingensis TaxID=45067 RepID=A0A0W0VQ82_9GAMM|nr:hypothetical protein [Legionella lansingensis]KTD22286.1 hypothetical protein Llan_1227 [Legionella lansingensis]SNV50649.1 Uncharacterised protein [Legionella lansingensis]
MEDTKERVFAYTLAKTLDNEQLDKVSGGAANMTSKPTLGPTGGSGGYDGIVDCSWDW